jgi:hypothetical protein
MVTFLVGECDKEKQFIVHKEFACCYSHILNAAFNSKYIEGQTQTYRFGDTTEEVIQLLVQWLYRQSLDILQLEPSATYDYAEYESLFDLWILADRLFIPQLQNFVLYRRKKIIIDKHKLMLLEKFDYIY